MAFLIIIFCLFLLKSGNNENQYAITNNDSKKINIVGNEKLDFPDKLVNKNPKIYDENLKELSPNNYEYILSSDNFLNITISDDNIKSIKYVEFDDNQLEGIYNKETNNLVLKSTYEIVPGKNKLVVFYNDNTKIEFNLNIKYLYDSEVNEKNIFLDNWIFHNTLNCPAFMIRNEGEVVLGGKCDKTIISMEYEKNFDKDVHLVLDFVPLKSNTVDMQLTFGERIYINFNNKRIEFKRKEYDEGKKKKEIINVSTLIYDKFKNNEIYRIDFSRKENFYQLKIINNKTNEILIEANYVDDGKNKLEYEKYKNLRISVGSNNMRILVSRIEIF